MDGRVKTLHPKIHSGILNIRQNKKHQKEMKINKYENIDLVVINFYPFEKVLFRFVNSMEGILDIKMYYIRTWVKPRACPKSLEASPLFY